MLIPILWAAMAIVKTAVIITQVAFTIAAFVAQMVFRFVVAVALAAIRLVVKMVTATIRWTLGNNPGEHYFELFAFRHFDWMRARRSQEDFEASLEELIADLGDADNNGIPDAYDEEFQSGTDPLDIKYPARPLIQNDYVRYLPRARTLTPVPMPIGMKGIVRSEEMLGGLASISGGGQFVTVKWNFGHLFTTANALDLHRLGYVNPTYRVTE